ncbi:MAG: siphovirus Gp157 family protein [Hyphomicrobiaceae bacterium]
MISLNVPHHRLDGQLQLSAQYREELLSQFPDLDDETLADTLEGLTDLNEILVAMVRSALDDEALAAALSTRLGDMKARLDRFTRRAKSKRSLVLEAMTKAELKKIVEADFTISVRSGAPTVEVIEEDRLPEIYWKPQPPKFDRQLLLSDLKHGATIAGAHLAPRAQQLSVRVK